MNRKTLVLPAVVGLLAPCSPRAAVPTAGATAATPSSWAPPTGSATEGRPGPARPGVRVRRRHLERPAPDRADADGPAPGERRPVPEAAAELRLHRHRQRALPLHAARRPEVLQRRPDHREGRQVLHRPRPRHQGRQRRVLPAVHHRHRRDAGRPRGHLPPQDRRTPPSRTSCRPRSPASSTPTTTTKSKLRDGFAVDGSGPYTLEGRGQGRPAGQGRLHQEPELPGRR